MADSDEYLDALLDNDVVNEYLNDIVCFWAIPRRTNWRYRSTSLSQRGGHALFRSKYYF